MQEACFNVDVEKGIPSQPPEVVRSCIGMWGEWEQCNVTCGGGVRSRAYQVIVPATEGVKSTCPAKNGELLSGSCNAHLCPVIHSISFEGDYVSTSETEMDGLKSKIASALADLMKVDDDRKIIITDVLLGSTIVSFYVNATDVIFIERALANLHGLLDITVTKRFADEGLVYITQSATWDTVPPGERTVAVFIDEFA